MAHQDCCLLTVVCGFVENHDFGTPSAKGDIRAVQVATELLRIGKINMLIAPKLQALSNQLQSTTLLNV